MHSISLKGFVVGAFAFLSGVSAFSQDLIASQAPIDRRLKAVDSVAIQRIINKTEMGSDAGELYTTWNTQNTHCYSSAELPDSFKIDLRGFCMPTPSRNITSRYGYRATFRRQHKGLDIKVYTGDTIVAAFDGKVRIVRYDRGGYGKYVVIRHTNGLETIYGHLSKQLVAVDDEVKAGAPIGLGGNTGRSTGSHLHFETRLLGRAIDPALMFDFVNQDVTGDFFVFYKNEPSHGSAMAQAGGNGRDKGTAASSGSSQRSFHYYKVKRGESLYVIAGKLGLSVDKLCSINRLKKKSVLRPGQILRY